MLAQQGAAGAESDNDVARALLRKVDLLTPNATEAGLMTGRRVDSLTAAAEAADVLHAQGAGLSITRAPACLPASMTCSIAERLFSS